MLFTGGWSGTHVLRNSWRDVRTTWHVRPPYIRHVFLKERLGNLAHHRRRPRRNPTMSARTNMAACRARRSRNRECTLGKRVKGSSPRRRLTSVCWDSSPSGFAGFSFGLGFSIRLPVSSNFLATSSVVANFLPLAFLRSFLAKKSSKSAMVTRQSPDDTRTERGRFRTCDERVNYNAPRTRPITDWSGSSMRPSTWACLHRKSVASSARVKRATKRPWQGGISRRRRSSAARERSVKDGLATPTIFHASSVVIGRPVGDETRLRNRAGRWPSSRRPTWKEHARAHNLKATRHVARVTDNRARSSTRSRFSEGKMTSSGFVESTRSRGRRAKSESGKGHAARGVERRG